ncbi:acyltransferase [Rossellomorea aquimaris]|uniref:Acyltransferase 3 domain-containing protein n=1 Tax=Rossellomorea aquimaris TaxID=189382 RepID=A0A1J6WPD2_9BACI|nr:acyltransferase [Rossellomorea aquimaris]OIU67689.1 hypothetical protein BHE18_12735 [Rossellomorea aquimaris]
MKRNDAIDYLKFFAIFAVILIHAGPFEEVTVRGIEGQYIDFTIDTLSRFAVPFFFITSGYLLGKKMRARDGSGGGVYFSKYVSKLSILFASWFIFYMLYDLAVQVFFHSFPIASVKETMRFLGENIRLEVFFYGESSGYQLWYLVALIWSIIILYVFLHLNKLNLLLLASFGLHLTGLFGQSYSGLISLPFGTRDAVFFGLLYTTLGAYAAYNEQTIKKKIKDINEYVWLGLFIVFSFLLIIERGITVFILDGKIGDYFLLSLPVTIALFLFALSKPELGKDSVITKIGRETAGIYVIHVFYIKFIHLLIDVMGYPGLEERVVWHILFSPLVLVLSYVSYELLQKVKKRVVKPMIRIKGISLAQWKQ